MVSDFFWDDDDEVRSSDGGSAATEALGKSGAAASLFSPASKRTVIATSTTGRSNAQARTTLGLPKTKSKVRGAGAGYAPAATIPPMVRDDIAFQKEITRVAKKYNFAEDDLYRVISFETSGTFSPSIKNKGGSPMYGLIQFDTTPKKSWAVAERGLTRDHLIRMTRAEQMKWVDEFFSDKGLDDIENPSVDDVYLTVYKPKFRGYGPDHLHARKGDKDTGEEYTQNRGFDRNGDTFIYTHEITAHVRDHDMTDIGKYKPPKSAAARTPVRPRVGTPSISEPPQKRVSPLPSGANPSQRPTPRSKGNVLFDGAANSFGVPAGFGYSLGRKLIDALKEGR